MKERKGWIKSRDGRVGPKEKRGPTSLRPMEKEERYMEIKNRKGDKFFFPKKDKRFNKREIYIKMMTNKGIGDIHLRGGPCVLDHFICL